MPHSPGISSARTRKQASAARAGTPFRLYHVFPLRQCCLFTLRLRRLPSRLRYGCVLAPAFSACRISATPAAAYRVALRTLLRAFSPA